MGIAASVLTGDFGQVRDVGRNGLAVQFAALDAQQRLRRVVGETDPALGVHNNNRRGHGLDQRSETLPGFQFPAGFRGEFQRVAPGQPAVSEVLNQE